MVCLPRHFTASGLVLWRPRQVLLVRHHKLGVWLYPGGHVEPTETPDQTVIREISEETGVEAELLGLRAAELDDAASDVHALHTPYQVLCEYIDDSTAPHYHIDLVYLCGVRHTTDAVDGLPDAAGIFDERHAMELTLFPNFRALLRRVFADEDAWQLLDVAETKHR